jgi:hypothetical protein
MKNVNSDVLPPELNGISHRTADGARQCGNTFQ